MRRGNRGGRLRILGNSWAEGRGTGFRRGDEGC